MGQLVPPEREPVAQRKAAVPQPMLTWLGVVDMNNLLGDTAGGITFDTLADNGIAGSVVTVGHLADSCPDWLIAELTAARSHGLLYVGSNIADPLPTSSTEWDSLRGQGQANGQRRRRCADEPLGFPSLRRASSERKGAARR